MPGTHTTSGPVPMESKAMRPPGRFTHWVSVGWAASLVMALPRSLALASSQKASTSSQRRQGESDSSASPSSVHSPLLALPVGLAQLALEDLAGGGQGQRLDELHRPRRLVAGDPLGA